MNRYLIIAFILMTHLVSGQDHPGLILTPSAVREMNSAQAPLFEKSLQEVVDEVAVEMQKGIDVPVPKDLAGGYTHETHKRNFFTMQKAGVLFQITGDEKYAVYIRDMLLQYARIYPTLDKHPATRSYARGKFFWQCLNDANWLVYTSQAYDCIYDWLDKQTVKKLNKELFRPYAEYISIQNPQFFNRIHNHSTWGNAAVGMIGLIMQDTELINWALYGLDVADLHQQEKDNDGGSLDLKNQGEAGFIAQIDHSFSPDGYFTEGPYYQRYAMYPFLIFAQALANKKPDLDILNYRDRLLIKAVYALINQTNGAGEFFPFNDAQKGMSLASRELVNAVSMAYFFGDQDPSLLSIIEKQDRVPLNDAGLSAASAIAQGLSQPFDYKSLELSDGAKGDEGGIGILRADDMTLVMKYAKHGMGHGHFDRLGFMLYDGGDEVIQDYGSARWVNIEHKDGGGYLKENHSWAKETIAHNTLVVNKDSHFDGNVQAADLTSGTRYSFTSTDSVSIVSAREENAYKDVKMQRTMALLTIEELERPLVLDLLTVQAPKETRYDLPLYYQGELMSVNQQIEANTTLSPMGQESGYQHLWAEGQAAVNGDMFQMTWFNGKHFYTVTSATTEGDEMIFTRIGANDPKFNLRRDPGLIQRRVGGNTVFASVYETHGFYSYSDEIPLNSFTSISDLSVDHNSEGYVVAAIELTSGKVYRFAFSLKDNDPNHEHSVETSKGEIKWKGIYDFKRK